MTTNDTTNWTTLQDSLELVAGRRGLQVSQAAEAAGHRPEHLIEVRLAGDLPRECYPVLIFDNGEGAKQIGPSGIEPAVLEWLHLNDVFGNATREADREAIAQRQVLLMETILETAATTSRELNLKAQVALWEMPTEEEEQAGDYIASPLQWHVIRHLISEAKGWGQ